MTVERKNPLTPFERKTLIDCLKSQLKTAARWENAIIYSADKRVASYCMTVNEIAKLKDILYCAKLTGFNPLGALRERVVASLNGSYILPDVFNGEGRAFGALMSACAKLGLTFKLDY